MNFLEMETEGTTSGAASTTVQPFCPINCQPNQERETPYVVGERTNEQRSYMPAPNDDVSAYLKLPLSSLHA